MLHNLETLTYTHRNDAHDGRDAGRAIFRDLLAFVELYNAVSEAGGPLAFADHVTDGNLAMMAGRHFDRDVPAHLRYMNRAFCQAIVSTFDLLVRDERPLPYPWPTGTQVTRRPAVQMLQVELPGRSKISAESIPDDPIVARLNRFFEVARSIDRSRLHRCAYCHRLFFARRKDAKACSKSHANSLRVRKFQSKRKRGK